MGQTALTKTKIDERREREAYDLAHPWQPMASAIINDGRVCELLFNTMTGPTDAGKSRFFLTADDKWCRIDPPGYPTMTAINWRPTNAKLSPTRRAEIIQMVRSW